MLDKTNLLLLVEHLEELVVLPDVWVRGGALAWAAVLVVVATVAEGPPGGLLK